MGVVGLLLKALSTAVVPLYVTDPGFVMIFVRVISRARILPSHTEAVAEGKLSVAVCACAGAVANRESAPRSATSIRETNVP